MEKFQSDGFYFCEIREVTHQKVERKDKRKGNRSARSNDQLKSTWTGKEEGTGGPPGIGPGLVWVWRP